MRVAIRAAAVVLIARFANAGPCGSAVNMTVSSREDADNLREALLCEGAGEFEVVWNGTVQIARSMAIGNGSFLNVTGMYEAVALSSPRSSRKYCSVRARAPQVAAPQEETVGSTQLLSFFRPSSPQPAPRPLALATSMYVIAPTLAWPVIVIGRRACASSPDGPAHPCDNGYDSLA